MEKNINHETDVSDHKVTKQDSLKKIIVGKNNHHKKNSAIKPHTEKVDTLEVETINVNKRRKSSIFRSVIVESKANSFNESKEPKDMFHSMIQKPVVTEPEEMDETIVDQDKLDAAGLKSFFSQMVQKKVDKRTKTSEVVTWDKLNIDEKKVIVDSHYKKNINRDFIPILDQKAKQLVRAHNNAEAKKDFLGGMVEISEISREKKIATKTVTYFKDDYTDIKYCKTQNHILKPGKKFSLAGRKFSDEIEDGDKKEFDKHITSPLLKRKMNTANYSMFQKQAKQREIQSMNRRFLLRNKIMMQDTTEIGVDLERKSKARIEFLNKMFKSERDKDAKKSAIKRVNKDLLSVFIEAADEDREFLIDSGGISEFEITGLLEDFMKAFNEATKIDPHKRKDYKNLAEKSRANTKVNSYLGGVLQGFGRFNAPVEKKLKLGHSYDNSLSLNRSQSNGDLSTLSVFETKLNEQYKKMHKLTELMANIDSFDVLITSKKKIIQKRQAADICLKLIEETKKRISKAIDQAKYTHRCD